MARNYNRLPLPLLGFLDQKSDGTNPSYLLEYTTPTLELLPFFWPRNTVYVSGTWAGGIKGVVLPLAGYTLGAVPAGEAWFVQRMAVHGWVNWVPGTPPGADAYVSVAPAIYFSGNFFEPIGSSNQVRFSAAEMAAWDAQGMASTPPVVAAYTGPPFFVLAGDRLFAEGAVLPNVAAAGGQVLVQADVIRISL